MITELAIEGFKSFGSPAETIALGPLNVLIGANASGKTNLLCALRFLQNAVAHDVAYAVSEMGGSAEVRNKRLRQRREPKPVRLSLKLEREFKFSIAEDSEQPSDMHVIRSFKYDLTLNLRRDDATPTIEAESLHEEAVRHGKTSTIGLNRSGNKVVIHDPTSGALDQTISVPEQEPTRLALVGVGFIPFLRRSSGRKSGAGASTISFPTLLDTRTEKNLMLRNRQKITERLLGTLPMLKAWVELKPSA